MDMLTARNGSYRLAFDKRCVSIEMEYYMNLRFGKNSLPN